MIASPAPEYILGVDPGTIRMGYGLLEVRDNTPNYLTCGVLNGGASRPLGERLWKIYQGLTDVLRTWGPNVVAMEEAFIPNGSLSGGAGKGNIRSAIMVGQAGALVLLAAAGMGLPAFTYAPTQVKSAVTSYGRSNKAQVQEMVRLTLGLELPPQPVDAADALAVALCYLNHRRQDSLIGSSIK
jgi:crossover junction endodeoxyribonuclease RuvC